MMGKKGWDWWLTACCIAHRAVQLRSAKPVGFQEPQSPLRSASLCNDLDFENARRLKTNDVWWKFFKDVCQFAGYNVVFAETMKWLGNRPADRNPSLVILAKQPLSTLMNKCNRNFLRNPRCSGHQNAGSDCWICWNTEFNWMMQSRPSTLISIDCQDTWETQLSRNQIKRRCFHVLPKRTSQSLQGLPWPGTILNIPCKVQY